MDLRRKVGIPARVSDWRAVWLVVVGDFQHGLMVLLHHVELHQPNSRPPPELQTRTSTANVSGERWSMNEETSRSAPSPSGRRFALFFVPAAVTSRRVLVARNGVEDGCAAAAETIAWAWAHRADVEGMSHPLGYLFREGHGCRPGWMSPPS
jgi:hypothetical protein